MRFQSLTVAVVGFLVLSGISVAPIHAQSMPSVNALAEPPDTPVGEELAWFIDLLNGNSELLSERDVATHFTPAALSELPPPLLIAYAQQFAEAFGPATFLAAARPSRPNHLVGYLSGRDDATFLVVLATEATSPNRLTGVALLPTPPPASLPAMAPESLGGVFDVGGRTMFLSCSGTGSPTVILEAGYGDSGGLWAPVQNGIAPLTRVCSYDRPNVSAGASDPAPTPRSAVDQVVDLHTLLAAAHIPGPYILVAHSYGGLISRLYASTYADDVAGMVLIDTVHEDRALQRQAMVSPEQWAAFRDLEAQFRDFEKLDQEASWSQVRAAQRSAPLRPMPLMVLAAGRAADPSFLPPGWPLAEEEQLHQQLQLDLAHLVPGGEYVLVKEGSHYIQHEQPELVIEAIGEVVSAVRNHGARGTPVVAEPGPTTLATSLDALLLAGVNEGLQGVALQVDRGNDVLFAGAAGLASGPGFAARMFRQPETDLTLVLLTATP